MGARTDAGSRELKEHRAPCGTGNGTIRCNGDCHTAGLPGDWKEAGRDAIAGVASAAKGARAAARAKEPGIVYRRTDSAGGKPYIGRADNEKNYGRRQTDQTRKNPSAEFRYEIVDRGKPGTQLAKKEEDWIRSTGTPTTKKNPNGTLANKRHEMNDRRYRAAGGKR